MLIAATTVLVGFIILIWSADLFVAGAASIAENLGMSPIVIGLTIVSLGTSAPEVLVSLTASFSDAGELAIGNAIGSNIANIGLVLGSTLMIAPLMVRQSSMKTEMPSLLLVTVAVGLLILDGELSRLDGCLMLVALALTLLQVVRGESTDPARQIETDNEPLPHLNPLRAWLTFAVGLLLLIISSRMLVWGAVSIAQEIGVSELVIGLTIVAIGTSLPELAATAASALRGHTEIALGNVIGSNLFNLLAVMAIPGIVTTQAISVDVLHRDYPIMTAMTFFLAAAIFVSRKRSKSAEGHSYLGRIIGALLLSFYGLYYYWLYLTV